MMKQRKRSLLLLSIISLLPLQICQLAYGVGPRLKNYGNIVFFTSHFESTKGSYDICQESERWEKLTNPHFSLRLIGWQLVINPGSSDKYMDKRIVGRVNNNSKEEFSEVKIEFVTYDEDGNQIAIVSSSHYDFKPGIIWKFEIPVTADVGKAELKGLYIRSHT
ncbi:MAG TPA: FxLYD domain-containing protein [Thermodesulfobacteriota bacterium]|nr:FxLYD domain-containing protein [Thermodesulfobacteriota bacterium]